MAIHLANPGGAPSLSDYGAETTGPRRAVGRVVRPPVWALAAAGVCLLVSAFLVTLGGEWAHGAGWALSSFVSIGFLATYSRLDVHRAESEPRYVYRPDLARLRTGLVVVAFAGAVAHAWLFATLVAS